MYLNDKNTLPPEQVGIDLPEEFIRYYHDKTANIRDTLDDEDELRTIFTQELPL